MTSSYVQLVVRSRAFQTLFHSLAIVLLFSAHALAGGESIRFNDDWRFEKADSAGAEKSDFDDSGWTKLRLPHDWAIAGPFIPEMDGYAGKLPWKGVGWYRKEFTLDRPEGSQVYLDFDGVMAFPKVYINGQLAGEWDYGYTPFRIDATKFVNLKGKNTVAVRVDTTNHGTRWYPGAGIYRNVMLEVREPVHIAQWGVFVTTPEVTDDAATVKVRAVVENHTDDETEVGVVFSYRDPNGKSPGSDARPVKIPAHGSEEVEIELQVRDPQRWDVDHPHLYTLETSIIPLTEIDDKEIDLGTAMDQVVTPFGIRTFEFTADDGFHLNGRRVQLYGVNLHHDHGALGGAFYTRAMERQLEIMKEMGVNALRTSHNAPAKEVLELCDRMGILVWDECFDKWNHTADRVKGQPSHEEHGERHLRSMVLRDRNHPSIIIWSIGNEIPDDREGVNPERVKMMADIVRKYDTSRPTGLGSCFPPHVEKGIYEDLDVVGWNYLRRYGSHRALMPQIPIVYSESASALSTRDAYELPLAETKTDYASEHRVDSYDLNAASWSDIPDQEFALMQRDPFVAGEFVWTGFDYLGEPTPYSKEAKSSYFGIVDLAGIPKDRYWLYRSYWRPEETTVHITPHWNWSDKVGQNVPVFVYTNGDSAELFLNGKSLGRRTKGERPKRPENLAIGRTLTASTSQSGNDPAKAVDGDFTSRWCASSNEPDQWLQVDLGDPLPVKCILIEFEKETKNYGYELKVSENGENWVTVAKKDTSREPEWGGPSASIHDFNELARYVRIEFTDLMNRQWASISEFGVYPEHAESMYYDCTYDYRLRWNDVAYEPGELKVVAYKDGQEIGTAIKKTAGALAKLQLTADRKELSATGDDLCHVLVEGLDKDGVLCPDADNKITFKIDGPAEIAGVDNGDPLSIEPFQADYRKLFHGKAMLILRTKPSETGAIKITASGDGLESATAEVTAQRGSP
jgi:beta-galactosidase